jgi:predicted DNA-binding transcriptional regulator YafY
MLSTSSRLLRLLSLLQTRRHWAGAELAERLGVHARTLRRDIDRLRELGYPVQASSGVAGGYAFRAGQTLPPLLLDDEEALAAALTLRLATAGSIAGIEESALRAMVKLEQVMPTRLRRRADALRSAIVPLGRVGPTVDAVWLGTLATACRDQLRVDFAYTDREGRASTRSVEPQGVVHTDDRWYLVAWDPARQDWRTFRVDRMAAPPVLGAHFAPRLGPEGGDLRAFVSRSLALNASPERARVILHAPLDEMARRIPPSAGVLEAVDAQRCLLQCAAAAQHAVVYWLLALDVDFEVLGPACLVEQLQRAHQRLTACLPAPAAAQTTQRRP